MAFPFDLAVGAWGIAPSTGNYRISDVAVSPSPGGVEGVSAVITAWCGAAFDTLRKDLLIFGGGHAAYAGNEIYAFSVDSTSGNFLQWRRKITSSTRTDGSNIETYSDGTPSSRHTYNNLIYLPTQDVLMCGPGSYKWGTAGGFSDQTYWFDASTETPTTSGAGKWTTKATKTATSPSGEQGGVKVYSASTGLIYTQEQRGFQSYNPSTDTWANLTTFEGAADYISSSGALALTSPEKLVRVGGGNTYIRQITTPYSYTGSETSGASTTGDTNIEGGDTGIFWEPNLNKIVAWGGTVTGGTDNRDWYTLDVGTLVWTKQTGTGDTPDNPTANGTFNRFAYVGDGLAILVNSTTSNVYFLRTSAAAVVTDPVGSIRPRTTVSIVP